MSTPKTSYGRLKMRVSATVELAMGHRLAGYPGLCSWLHGHNYLISVEVEGNPNPMGFVVDFKDLKEDLKAFLKPMDHCMMLWNEDADLEYLSGVTRLVVLNVNPSAENIASLVFNAMQDANYRVTSVTVQETRDNVAIASAVDRNVRVMDRYSGQKGD
jgi:6-pyruvoyltetrahydropterin/6-carboxytetrahydropterin synthase